MPPTDTAHADRPSPRTAWVLSWLLFLLKNVVGWALILASFVIGPTIPGPGGIPVFIVGFALITFPGKRRATARVMRGLPADPNRWPYRLTRIGAAVLLPAAALAYVQFKWHPLWGGDVDPSTTAMVAVGSAVAALAIWLAGYRAALVNRLIAAVPKVRRKVRPWMRRKGIDLLPPRRGRRFVEGQAEGQPVVTNEPTLPDENTILGLHPRHVTRFRAAWRAFRPWLKRGLAVGVTVAIFAWILKPIVKNWDVVRDRVYTMNWWRVLAASALFAVVLFVFRAMVWRRLLKNFGHKLPTWAATRIWSTSELARYLPGSIWQVVGRVYLAKPYGVRGSVVSTSQIMELALFLLANLIVALGALVFLGLRSFHGVARFWMIVAAVLVPLLSLVLHPKIFYTLADKVLTKLKKPPVRKRMRWRTLIHLLLWNVIGLLAQGMAIYLVVFRLLHLPIEKWWVVTGAYCLAWCAGFLAFWAPGGLGVREAVFIAAMSFTLSKAVRAEQLEDPAKQELFLIFLSVLLRIWATVGELILAGVAYAIDWRAAMNPPIPPPEPVEVVDEMTRTELLPATASREEVDEFRKL